MTCVWMLQRGHSGDGCIVVMGVFWRRLCVIMIRGRVMSHVCFYVCCSDCVEVCGNVCCVSAVVKHSVFLAFGC